MEERVGRVMDVVWEVDSWNAGREVYSGPENDGWLGDRVELEEGGEGGGMSGGVGTVLLPRLS